MLKNFIKIAWRNIINNKVYSSLNILGLAAGMAVVALLIALWVNYQYSFDKFVPNYKQLYEVRRNFNSNGDTLLNFNTTSLKLAGVLRTIPEIEDVVVCDGSAPHGLKVGEKKLFPVGLQITSNFLKSFRYPFVSGNADAALKDPYSIVLTESTARALFGTVDAINKTVRVDNHDNLKVTAVLKDMAANSSMRFDYLIPFTYMEQTLPWVKQLRTGSFADNVFVIYAVLKPGISYAQVAPKIKNIEKSETGNSNAMNSGSELCSHWPTGICMIIKTAALTVGFIQYVHLFSLIGALVLLIAGINFINLSTARSEKRAREVGVRKAIGAQRKGLILQFLIESAVVTFISFLFSLLFVQARLARV